MSNTTTRRALHAYLSDEAHEQWHEFAAIHGVSVSALLETFSSRLTADASESSEISDELDAMVAEARRVDAARRRRRPAK